MAKNTEVATDTAVAESTATPDSRLIMLDVPAGHAVTTLGEHALAAGKHPRNAVIRAFARTGEYDRGSIAKIISELQGVKVAYQIVFQATKGIPNVKAAPKAEAAAPAQAGETVAAGTSEVAPD